MKTEGISQQQIIQFFILFFYSTFVGFSSVQLIKMAQYDSLIVIFIGGLSAVVQAFIGIKLANRRPDQFIVIYGKEIFPYWIHFFLMGAMFFFCFHGSAFMLREYEDFIIQVYLPETPNWAIGILFGATVAIMARLGIVTLFRSAQGLFFITILAILLNTLFVGKELRWERSMAFITNHDFQGILQGGYFISPFFCEIVLLIFIFPYIMDKKRTRRSLFWAIFFSISLIIIYIGILILLFGPNLTVHLAYPILEMVRFIKIAEFIENLDPLLIAVWSTMVYIKISFFFYLAVQILAQLLKLKDYRPLTFSLAAVVVSMSVTMAENYASLIDVYEHAWPTFALCVESIPLLYLLMDTIKNYVKKKSMNQIEKKQ
ncbi:GerAB/ArcD/ProY family transporter [Neobacillus drentensis]|uniref:GerAB/ArcD/ProY family transporter n=1 Tax=Neobacillus drentensis TaxID=220684 RepID=UPI001F246D7D|nr:GerAB/ArcD/ProY family transporter [Neobacillus drentensis]ULT57277.1 GerAB/ArcD/ProY family transporter [Neobacillus drentensis]